MPRFKTAMVFAALLSTTIANAQSESTTSTTVSDRVAGLRVQIDENGNRVQGPLPGNSSATPAAAQPIQSQSAVSRNGGPGADQVPQVVEAKGGAGKVVRLNGLFRAGSRATIGADGKLAKECQVETAPVVAGGQP